MSGIYAAAASFHVPTPSSPSTSCRRPTVKASVAVSAASRTPYEILHVKKTATAAEIKTAYRSLAKRFHPDACVANGQDDFIEIHDAYATLSDPVAKARYDASAGRWKDARTTYGMSTGRWETDQCW